MSKPPPPEGFGSEEFAAAMPVSRETLARLKAYVGMLRDWNSRHNLVSAASLDEVWHRHIYDSAQLLPLIPEDVRTAADLGSGAGFPGLVLAAMQPRLRLSLFEATRKKADFLQAVAGHLGLDVVIRNERIEDAPAEVFDLVTARACAPLSQLLAYAQKFVGPATVCLFPKGQNLVAELTEARKSWKMRLREFPSLTHPFGIIVEIRDLTDVRRGG